MSSTETQVSGRRADVIYCDDIRYEINHKNSLIGVYEGDLVLNAPAPTTVPKLCVRLRVSTPLEKPFRRIHIVAEINKKVIVDSAQDIPVANQPKPGVAPSVNLDDPDWFYKRGNLHFILVLSPFLIEAAPSILKIKLVADDDENINVRPLRILPGPIPTDDQGDSSSGRVDPV